MISHDQQLQCHYSLSCCNELRASEKSPPLQTTNVHYLHKLQHTTNTLQYFKFLLTVTVTVNCTVTQIQPSAPFLVRPARILFTTTTPCTQPLTTPDRMSHYPNHDDTMYPSIPQTEIDTTDIPYVNALLQLKIGGHLDFNFTPGPVESQPVTGTTATADAEAAGNFQCVCHIWHPDDADRKHQREFIGHGMTKKKAKANAAQKGLSSVLRYCFEYKETPLHPMTGKELVESQTIELKRSCIPSTDPTASVCVDIQCNVCEKQISCLPCARNDRHGGCMSKHQKCVRSLWGQRDKYISAFLNSGNGGSMFFGIHDGGYVVGQPGLDETKQAEMLDETHILLASMHPAVDVNLCSLEFHRVRNAPETEPDSYVVELRIAPNPQCESTVYFTKKGHAYFRHGTAALRMRGGEIQSRHQVPLKRTANCIQKAIASLSREESAIENNIIATHSLNPSVDTAHSSDAKHDAMTQQQTSLYPSIPETDVDTDCKSDQSVLHELMAAKKLEFKVDENVLPQQLFECVYTVWGPNDIKRDHVQEFHGQGTSKDRARRVAAAQALKSVLRYCFTLGQPALDPYTGHELKRAHKLEFIEKQETLSLSKEAREVLNQHISGFLNSGDGGSIFWGIDTNGRVVGLRGLNTKMRDGLGCKLHELLGSFHPSVSFNNAQAHFHVVHGADEDSDTYVVEIRIRMTTQNDFQSRVFFTESGSAYVRNGRNTSQMLGIDIYRRLQAPLHHARKCMMQAVADLTSECDHMTEMSQNSPLQ
jgi:Schlafen, AlbA_2